MYKKFFLVIILLLLPSVIPAATIENKHLLVDVDDETGRIYLSTVEGCSDILGDERINLLFFDRPPASYTVIYVSNDAFIYGSHRGRFTKRPVTVGKSISAFWENNLISVLQNVQFIQRKSSGIEDGVLITYTIENKTDFPLDTGIRFLFDTSLGEKGKYHFDIPGTGKICYETEFGKNELPDYWLSVGLSEDTSICLRGVIKENVVTSPDKIVFANYKALRESYYYYRIRKKNTFDFPPHSRNDSAVAIYYNPTELAAGASRKYSTILGLCGEGEYGEDEGEILEVKEKPGDQELPLEKEEKIEPEVKPHREVDADLIKKELAKIDELRGSLEKINNLIEQINLILDTEEKIIEEDELMRLKNTLIELEQMSEK